MWQPLKKILFEKREEDKRCKLCGIEIEISKHLMNKCGDERRNGCERGKLLHEPDPAH